MKKNLFYLLVLMFICPITIFAQENVSVKSIILVEKGDSVEELHEPTADDLNINVDVKFNEVGESIKYKVEVENKDKEDYQLNMGKEFGTSDYIKYSYSYDNDSTILKANTTKVMFITISYDKEVPDTALTNGTYEEDNDMSIGVSREEDNPKTGRDELIVITVVLGLVILIGFIMINNRQAKYMVLALGVLLLIPTVSAIKHITITMNTKIKIERELRVCIYGHDPFDVDNYLEPEEEGFKEYVPYRPGETARQFDQRTGENFKFIFFIKTGYEQCIIEHGRDFETPSSFSERIPLECEIYIEEIDGNSVLKDKTKGCYLPMPA